MIWTEWKMGTDVDFSDILYEKRYHKQLNGGVARITINRPERGNAFTEHTIDEMTQAFYDASQDKAIGVVVLTGKGERAFSRGGDMSLVPEEGSPGLSFNFKPAIEHMLRVCRKPVIAAVKGYVLDGANHLSYMCDFTIAADNSIFGQIGPRFGIPASGYIVNYLVRVVGAKKAREMWMLCRRYSAEEALEMGLVNKVVPVANLEEEIDNWCEDILSLSPTCIQILKASFDSEIEWDKGKWANLIAPDFFESDEIKEARQAWREKRKPIFWKPMADKQGTDVN